MPLPNQLGKFQFVSLQPDEQRQIDQLTDAINSLIGYNGTVKLSNHLDLQGNRIMNVGAPVSPTDALSSGVAEAAYSATALQPKLQANGEAPLNQYRILGSNSQREPSSSFLNGLMSTVPNANQIVPHITNEGDAVQVVIPSSPFQFADGTSAILNGRTDLLSLPAEYTITSISVAGNVVTVVFSYSSATPPNIVAGNAGTIDGVSPSGFNGTFAWTFVAVDTGAKTVTLQYQDGSVSGSGSGGTVQENGVWYYAAKRGSSNVYLFGPFSGDTLQNRLQSCFDGFQIVAVVNITASGGQVSMSGGGGSAIVGSPTAGSFF